MPTHPTRTWHRYTSQEVPHNIAPYQPTRSRAVQLCDQLPQPLPQPYCNYYGKKKKKEIKN